MVNCFAILLAKKLVSKKPIIENHVKSSKHASGKEHLEKKEARRDIAEFRGV